MNKIGDFLLFNWSKSTMDKLLKMGFRQNERFQDYNNTAIWILNRSEDDSDRGLIVFNPHDSFISGGNFLPNDIYCKGEGMLIALAATIAPKRTVAIERYLMYIRPDGSMWPGEVEGARPATQQEIIDWYQETDKQTLKNDLIWSKTICQTFGEASMYGKWMIKGIILEGKGVLVPDGGRTWSEYIYHFKLDINKYKNTIISDGGIYIGHNFDPYILSPTILSPILTTLNDANIPIRIMGDDTDVLPWLLSQLQLRGTKIIAGFRFKNRPRKNVIKKGWMIRFRTGMGWKTWTDLQMECEWDKWSGLRKWINDYSPNVVFIGLQQNIDKNDEIVNDIRIWVDGYLKGNVEFVCFKNSFYNKSTCLKRDSFERFKPHICSNSWKIFDNYNDPEIDKTNVE